MSDSTVPMPSSSGASTLGRLVRDDADRRGERQRLRGTFRDFALHD
jgi:hypothetical protein